MTDEGASGSIPPSRPLVPSLQPQDLLQSFTASKSSQVGQRERGVLLHRLGLPPFQKDPQEKQQERNWGWGGCRRGGFAVYIQGPGKVGCFFFLASSFFPPFQETVYLQDLLCKVWVLRNQHPPPKKISLYGAAFQTSMERNTQKHPKRGEKRRQAGFFLEGGVKKRGGSPFGTAPSKGGRSSHHTLRET